MPLAQTLRCPQGVRPPSPTRIADDRGFTLLQVLIVLVLAGIVMAMSLGGFDTALNTVRGDASMNIVLWQFKLARETAINQRRSVEVQFTPAQLSERRAPQHPERHDDDLDGRARQPDAVLSCSRHAGHAGRVRSRPAIAFGGAATVMFNARRIVHRRAGNILNGSVFIGKVGTTMTARALTVFGPTATIRTYRWNGSAWRH